MTAVSPIGTDHRIPALASYGPITVDTAGLGEIRNLVGGAGTARWKQLINGMHLAGGWGCVEYVVLPPGSSCGVHLHNIREEIYYIISGSAVMTVNGEQTAVTAGEVVTCPLGTVHGIGVPADAGEEMSFFVVEVVPGSHPPKAAPARIPVREQLQSSSVATVELSRYLTGPWGRFTLAEIPPGELAGYQLPGTTGEVLFVADGTVQIGIGDDLTVKGGAGLCAGTGLGAAVSVRNLSSLRSAHVIATQVEV